MKWLLLHQSWLFPKKVFGRRIYNIVVSLSHKVRGFKPRSGWTAPDRISHLLDRIVTLVKLRTWVALKANIFTIWTSYIRFNMNHFNIFPPWKKKSIFFNIGEITICKRKLKLNKWKADFQIFFIWSSVRTSGLEWTILKTKLKKICEPWTGPNSSGSIRSRLIFGPVWIWTE